VKRKKLRAGHTANEHHMQTEDQILSRVDVDLQLARLKPEDAEMLLMIYRVAQPPDYRGPWPPTFEDIGRYIGVKYGRSPLSEAAIRYRRKQAEDFLGGKRKTLRRRKTKNPE
jgi:hypothetical protein